LLGAPPRVPADLLWPLAEPTPRPGEPFWAGPDMLYLHVWTGFSVVVLSIVGYVLLKDLAAQVRFGSVGDAV
jgi:hypothetical protein